MRNLPYNLYSIEAQKVTISMTNSRCETAARLKDGIIYSGYDYTSYLWPNILQRNLLKWTGPDPTSFIPDLLRINEN
jgi:hypothetical protein